MLTFSCGQRGQMYNSLPGYDITSDTGQPVIEVNGTLIFDDEDVLSIYISEYPYFQCGHNKFGIMQY